MKRHIKYLFFCLALMLIILPTKSSAESINENNSFYINEDVTEENGVINPKWEYYNSLSDEEKAKWDVIPEKYIILNDNENSKNYYLKKGSYNAISYIATVPEAYDLRNSSDVSAVKNQGSLGLCWAFAANASLESYLLKKDISSDVFSERQLDYAGAKDTYVFTEGFNPYASTRSLGSGGTFSSATSYYAMGVSPVTKEGVWTNWNEYYNAMSLNDIFNLNNSKYLVTGYVRFTSVNRKDSEATKTTWRNKVKNQIINNGAVYISTLAPQWATSKACYVDVSKNGQTGLINWNEACEKSTTNYTYNGTHAMAIVGWDDNYSLSYCAYPNTGTTVANVNESSCTNGGGRYYKVNGAWILKNSWGNDYSPYVYLAYDSDYLEAGGITGVVPKDYDNSYNSLAPQTNISESGYKQKYVFYKPSPTEKLKRVTFETNTTSAVTYDVYYGDNSSDEYTLIGSVNADTPGRYSVEAHDELLTQEDFVIYIKPSKGSLFTKPSKVYAFTSNTQGEASATTIIDLNTKRQSNGTYKADVNSKINNLPTGTRLNFKIKDIYGNTIADYSDNQTIVVAGAYKGTITIPRSFDNNSIYYIETYANGQLIGKNSFANGISLASKSISGKTVYEIKNEADLKYLTTFEYKFSDFELANDITLSSSNFEPIGKNITDKFRGSLDGNGHTIYNLKQENDSTGLFYKIEASISDLKIKNADLTSTGNNSGVLASESYRSTITNVLTEGNLSTSSTSAYVGGIIGYAEDTDFKNVVNETSLSGNKSGEIVGYLGSNSTITNALNQGLVSNNRSAISTFFHSAALSNNSLKNAVDLAIENSPSCTTPYNGYSDEQLDMSNIIYLSDNNCNYNGTRVLKSQLKDSHTYSGFGSDWDITNGILPNIKENPVIYIQDFTEAGAKNLFASVNSEVNLTTTPNNATYKGVTLESEDESIVKVINKNKLQGVSPGQAKIRVTTADGTYITHEATVYVLDNELAARYDNGYLIIPENLSEENLQKDGMILSITNKNNAKIATGTKIEYKIGGQVVGSFIGVIKGDLNGDGQIQADDMLIMKRHILELDKNKPLTALQLMAGNITGNGINSIGILKMQRHILKLDGGGEL